MHGYTLSSSFRFLSREVYTLGKIYAAHYEFAYINIREYDVIFSPLLDTTQYTFACYSRWSDKN